MILRVKEIIERTFNLQSQDTPVGSESNKSTAYSTTRLQRLAGDNMNFTVDMLQLYILNTDRDLEDIRASCIQNDWKRVGLLAHKLIPGSSYLKIETLVKRLKDLEIKCEGSQDNNLLTQLVVETCDAYDEVRPIIVADINKLKRDKIF